MKNKSIITTIIGIMLIFTGVIIFATNQSQNVENNKESKKLRNIYLEEINDENAKEIIQFHLGKDSSNEKFIITKAKILATNKKGKFYIRLEIEEQRNTWDTEIQYLKDGIWEVKLPLTELGNYGDEYIEFWGVVEE